MKRLYWILPLCLSACSAQTNAESESADNTSGQIKKYSDAELKVAVSAAFPSDQLQRDAEGVEWRFKNHRLIDSPFGPILVSEAEPDINTIGHVTSGRIDVAYLDKNLSLNRRFSSAASIGSNGTVSEWALVSHFSELPLIYASGGFTGQGVTEGCSILVELAKDGPREVVQIPDYLGVVGGDELEGKIENIVNPTSFDVRYKGRSDGKNLNVVRRYVRSGNSYVRQGSAILDHCGAEE